MLELSADVRLRPTRVGFLTSPTDLPSLRAVMRACCCLWGGVFNPIIPVFRRAPDEWRPERHERLKGSEVTRGYVRFFEPDVYVETKKGLLEQAGLGALREEHAMDRRVITLEEFFQTEYGRSWSEPTFGLNVCDVLRHIYETKHQFLQRDGRANIYVEPIQGSALVEATFGAYPGSADVSYIRHVYEDACKPELLQATPDTWRRAFLQGAEFPLRLTRHGLDLERYWHHDRIIFVFDPRRPTDLIDLWNIRLEPNSILPLPVEWFEALSDDLTSIIESEHRPIVGNPSGMMHRATIEFARSISEETSERLVDVLMDGLPEGALVVKVWRNRIWVEHREERLARARRLKVTAAELQDDLTVKEGKQLHTTFKTVSPAFAERYGGRRQRWINALSVSDFARRNAVATVLPFNTFDRVWPRLGHGDTTIVSSEGWVFPQDYPNVAQWVTLLSPHEAIIGSLGQLGITASSSEPGHIARQMLEQVGGLRGVSLLADVRVLSLLNKMAGRIRRRRNEADTIEENFGLRTAPLSEWTKLAAPRNRRGFSKYSLEEFTKSNVIRLGLETDCPHCNDKNWHTLTDVDYDITCERCLKTYRFPQTTVRKNNRNFTYRVIGPFSVPDFARGSYSALLSLRLLNFFSSGSREMTFSTALDLSFDGIQREVDFVAWYGDQRMGRDYLNPPQLVIGEAKSLGRGELIKASDLAKLRSVAAKLPDAVICISVLRDHFTQTEKRLLERFVNWGRRPNAHGQPTNPVILLTSHELTMDYLLSATWKDIGGKHAEFADYDHTRNLQSFADATQQIYLDLPPSFEVRRRYWERRARRKPKVKDT